MTVALPSFDALSAKYGKLRGSYRIVLIETSIHLGATLRKVLEAMGSQVETADDGYSGVELVKSCQPDAVFCCMELSGLDGYEVSGEIRSCLGAKPLLVAHTGYGRWEIGEQAKEAGFDLLITKPAAMSELWRSLLLIEGTDDCEDFRL